MRRFQLTALVLLQVFIESCGQKSKDDPPPAVVERSGRSTVSVDSEFVDLLPRTDSAGNNIVFLSGRSPHKGTLRAYWSSNDSRDAPIRITNQEDYAETDLAISPDGQTVAIKYVKSSDQSGIYIQPLSNPQKRIDVQVDAENISNIEFSPLNSGILTFIKQSLDGTKVLTRVSFSLTSETITVNEIAAVADSESTEQTYRWSNSSHFKGVVSYALKGDVQGFYNRAYQTDGTLAPRTWIESSAFDGIVPESYSLGSLGLVYITELSDAEEGVPESDVESPGEIYLRKKALISGIDGQLIKRIDTKQFSPLGTTSTATGNLTAIWGTELFLCKSNEHPKGLPFFANSIVLETGAQQVKFLIKQSSDGGFEVVTSNYCASFDLGVGVGDQKIDGQFRNLQLAATYQNNLVKMVYQSWFGGDSEVYLLSMTFDGNGISSPVFTKISNNRRP